jgi:DNA-binding NtrC family response regulator
LSTYGWPGNGQALKHRIQRAVIMAAGPLLTPTDLVVNHRDFDMLEPLKSQRLVYAPAQATVPHQRPTDRVA